MAKAVLKRKPPLRSKGGDTLTFHVTIVVESDGDEYLAYCPELPGVLMPGATPQEALKNARVAASLCLETMIEYGDPIPLDSQRRSRKQGFAPEAEVHREEIRVCMK